VFSHPPIYGYESLGSFSANLLPQGCQRVESGYSQDFYTSAWDADYQNYYDENELGFNYSDEEDWNFCFVVCSFDPACVSYEGGVAMFPDADGGPVITSCIL